MEDCKFENGERDEWRRGPKTQVLNTGSRGTRPLETRDVGLTEEREMQEGTIYRAPTRNVRGGRGWLAISGAGR